MSNLVSSVFSIQTIMLSSNVEMASFPLIISRHFPAKLGRRPTAGKAPTLHSEKSIVSFHNQLKSFSQGKATKWPISSTLLHVCRSRSRSPGVARRSHNRTSDDGASDNARENRSILDRISPYLPEGVAHPPAHARRPPLKESAISVFAEPAKDIASRWVPPAERGDILHVKIYSLTSVFR